MSVIEDIKAQFRGRNVLMQIIIVNVAVFLCINIYALVLYFTGDPPLVLWDHVGDRLVSKLAMPFDPQLLLYHPWTLFTHFFVHTEFGHIFWNMLWLYFFGRFFVEYAGNNRILPVYFYGALCGATVAFLSYQFIPNLKIYEPAKFMLGASAGIMAIVVATATLVPNIRVRLFFLGEIPLKYIALFFVVIDLVSLTYYSNSGGHLAHLGGALFGYIFILQYKTGRDWSKGFNFVFDRIRSPFSKSGRTRMKVVHNRKKTDEEFNYEKNKMQQKVDQILDKISRSGYESLSKEEKEILFKSSDKI